MKVKHVYVVLSTGQEMHYWTQDPEGKIEFWRSVGAFAIEGDLPQPVRTEEKSTGWSSL